MKYTRVRRQTSENLFVICLQFNERYNELTSSKRTRDVDRNVKKKQKDLLSVRWDFQKGATTVT